MTYRKDHIDIIDNNFLVKAKFEKKNVKERTDFMLTQFFIYL